jgi:hypothetical protein
MGIVSEKPSYLGLLNAISLGESEAHCYLNAWAAVTPSEDVKAVIGTVALREGEHGLAFAKRINELGFSVLPRENAKFAELMEIAGSSRSDLEKMELLGLGRQSNVDEPDVFSNMFANKDIDITTGQLLGRYIAEERDSGRLLRSCYEQLKAGAPVATASGATSSEIAGLNDKVDELCRAVDELRQIVCAQTMTPEPAGNSKRK